jgi:YD repeat-containing protein
MRPTRSSLLRFVAGAVAMTFVVTGELDAASAAYTYDEAGRVRSVRYDNGVCVAYAYDAAGNRTAQTITSGGAPNTPTWGTGVFGCFYWTP